jgi:hypothetical protein
MKTESLSNAGIETVAILSPDHIKYGDGGEMRKVSTCPGEVLIAVKNARNGLILSPSVSEIEKRIACVEQEVNEKQGSGQRTPTSAGAHGLFIKNLKL